MMSYLAPQYCTPEPSPQTKLTVSVNFVISNRETTLA